MKAYRASSKHGGITAATPQQAAQAFFDKFPTARKCNVHEGESEGGFFTIRLSLLAGAPRAQSWKDVTKKQIASLPNSEAVAA